MDNKKTTCLDRQILETVSDMVIFHDLDLNISWANKSAIHGLDINMDLQTGKKCYLALNCGDDFCVECPVKETLNTRETSKYLKNCKDGRILKIRTFPATDSEGNFLGVIETIQDVTEQKKRERSIMESEERYRKVFDSAKDAMMHLDPETGRFTSANPALFDLFGIKDLNEFDSLSPWDISPETQPNGILSTILAKEMIHKAIMSGSNYFEWQHKRLNGDVFDAHVLLVKVTQNGRDILQATVRDITDKKHAEKKLKESLERYKALLAATPDLMFVYSKEGIFIDYHASKPELLMLPPSLFLNQHVEDVLPDYLAKITMHHLKLALESGLPREYNYSIQVLEEWHEYEARLVPFGSNKALAIVRDVTDRRKNEVALQQAHETYKGILDSLYDAVYILDKQGVFLATNKTVERWYGMTRDQIIGQTPAFLSAPGMNDLGQIFQYLQEAYKGKSSRFEFWAKRADGTIFPKEVVLTNGVYFGNKVILAVGRDITERKKAEEEIRQNLNWIASIFRVVPTGIGVVTDGEIMEINPQLSALTGYNYDDLVGKNASILFHSVEDFTNIREEILREVSEKGTGSFETRFVRKDGTTIDVLLAATPNVLTDFSKGITFTALDITQRKQTEKLLKHQSQLQQILMEISSNYINLPIDAIDEAIQDSLTKLGQFVHADRAYIFSYNFDLQICTNTHEWCASGIEPEIEYLQAVPLSNMTECVETHNAGKTMYVPNVSEMPPGQAKEILEPQHIKSLINVPMMHNNKPVGFVGFDSVVQHHTYSYVEKQMLEVYAQILVNIKLRKETSEKLIQSLARAEESDKLKTAFLANISHEVRTPLNGILGFTTLLGKPDLSPDKYSYYMNIITSSANQLTGIINDVVDIAKVETGQIDLYERETEINKEILKIKDVFSRLAQQKEIELIACLPNADTEVTILADQEKYGKILLHLVANAIKFTEKGTIEVGYSIKGNVLEFFVKDTGIGISPKHQSVIFERFRQVEIEATRRYGGTGLGLSIAKAYVEAMGGDIWVDSDLYRGSTFYFTLPKRDPIQKEKKKSNRKVEIPNLKGKTVIVAEDESSNFVFIQELIAETNATVIHTKTGRQTIEKATEQKPALILMDIKMPELDGYEAARRIKQLYPDIPIIATTAYGMAGDKEKCLEFGCDGYVAKPFNRETLLNMIMDLFDKKP
jgi:PAS domain S-box-containing protein